MRKTLNISSIIWQFKLVFLFTIAIYSTNSPAQTLRTGQWIRHLGGKSWDITSGIICDSKKNIYLSGSFYSSISSEGEKIDSKGEQDAFLAKFNQKGIGGLKSFGGPGMDLATSICLLQGNKIAICGTISDSADFGKLKIKGKGTKLYVLRCDDNLNPTGLTSLNYSGIASVSHSGTDDEGNIYLTGYFDNKISSGDLEISSFGKMDIFIAIINTEGKVSKLTSFGSVEDDFPSSLTIDLFGNLILSGNIGKTGNLKGLEFPTSKNTAKSNSFILSFDKNFSIRWVQQILGNDYCGITSSKSDKSGNIYVTGTFNSKLILPDTIFNSKGYTDGFILKLKSDGSYIWKRAFGSWYYDYSKEINVDNNDGAIISGSIGDGFLIDSLEINPEMKTNSSLFLQFDSTGKAIWGDCISGLGNSSSTGSVLDPEGNLYFTGYFQNEFKKGNSNFISEGDQDIFLMKYANCIDENYGIKGDRNFCPGLTTKLKVKRSYSNIIWNDTIKDKNTLETGKAGLYWVSAIDEKGCIISDSVMVKESKLPVFSLGNDTTISLLDTLILKAPGEYSMPHWSDLSQEQEYIVKSFNEIPNEKTVWLMVTDSSKCNYTDTIKINFIKTVAPVSDNSKLNVYPNPAHDNIWWSFVTRDEKHSRFTLEIVNEMGIKLYQQHIKDYIQGEERMLDIGGYPSGLYYLKLSETLTNKEIKSVRILKK
jgi:hypothetical protein